MIDKKELRIGNLLKCGDNIVKVEDIGDSGINLQWFHGLSGFDYGYTQLSPIELTPEWLDKLGVEQIWNNRWQHSEGLDIELFKDGYMILCEERTNWGRRYLHVHEIQNVFYWLTGKELIIKTI